MHVEFDLCMDGRTRFAGRLMAATCNDFAGVFDTNLLNLLNLVLLD